VKSKIISSPENGVDQYLRRQPIEHASARRM